MLLRLSITSLLLVLASSCGTRILPTKHVTVVSSPTLPIQRPSTIPTDWKRTEVADKFVFYMPADMKTDTEMDLVDTYGPAQAHFYVNTQLMWNYQYATVDLCTTPESLLKDPAYTESQVVIGGRRVTAHIWTSHGPGHSLITSCLSDIDGSGTDLHLGAFFNDQQGLAVALQIFAAIQLRKGAT